MEVFDLYSPKIDADPFPQSSRIAVRNAVRALCPEKSLFLDGSLRKNRPCDDVAIAARKTLSHRR